MAVRSLATLNHFLGLAPAKGPRVMRVAVDFIESLTLEFDQTDKKLSNIFGTPQAIYIDNSANEAPVKVIPAGSDMAIYCPSNSVGMFPFAVSEKFRATFIHTVANAHVDAWIFNSPQDFFCHAVV